MSAIPVSLLGTVIGTDVQIGVFLEKATNKVVRLRRGEDGWVLRLIKAREVTLYRDDARQRRECPIECTVPLMQRGGSLFHDPPHSVSNVSASQTSVRLEVSGRCPDRSACRSLGEDHRRAARSATVRKHRRKNPAQFRRLCLPWVR